MKLTLLVELSRPARDVGIAICVALGNSLFGDFAILDNPIMRANQPPALVGQSLERDTARTCRRRR